MTSRGAGVRSTFVFRNKAFRLTALLCTFSFVTLVYFQNCSNVRLVPTERISSTARQGQICTQSPQKLETPSKFIFLLDMSESLQGIDPSKPTATPGGATISTTRRVNGLRKLFDRVNQNQDDNFFASVGVFGNNVVGMLPDMAYPVGANPRYPGTITNGRPTAPAPSLSPICKFAKPRVTAERAELDLALQQSDDLGSFPYGTTPFGAAMSLAEECIKADIANDNSAQYFVVLVTDGAPTDITPEQARQQAIKLIQAGKKNAGDAFETSRVNLNMYFLEDLNASPDAATMVYNMIIDAQRNGGLLSRAIFKGPADELDYREVGNYRRIRQVLKQFYATNVTSAIGPDGKISADSDGDGLTDKHEASLGPDYNPLNHSTNPNCSDLVRYRNAGTCPSFCLAGLQFEDKDQDGLSNCDELSLATDFTNFDRDGDNIYDGLELRIGSDPLNDKDAAFDTDSDGAKTIDEAFRMTSIYHDDRNIHHHALPNISVRHVGVQNDENCYQVSIDPIPLFETQAVESATLTYYRHPARGNVIKFMFLQVPENSPMMRPTLLWSYKTLPFNQMGVGVINDISTDDFFLFNPYE